MAMYDLMHEADTPDGDIAKKHGVHTFEEYKLDPSVTSDYTEFQGLVFTICYAMHVGGNAPSYIIINRKKALKLIEELGEIPNEVEGVPLAFDEEMVFQTAWLA